MQLPFFYEENLPVGGSFILSEESSHHIVQVLRMKENETIVLTNGKGETQTAEITSANKKRTSVKILERNFSPRPGPRIRIAVGLIKNKTRLEWFVEKASEIGIDKIFPMTTRRTEKQSFNKERVQSIAISAMLQSQQSWTTEIGDLIPFEQLVSQAHAGSKFIAHCAESKKEILSSRSHDDSLILIGPEGDFTPEEIAIATQRGFIPVSLGNTRLRTETAAIIAAVICKFSYG